MYIRTLLYMLLFGCALIQRHSSTGIEGPYQVEEDVDSEQKTDTPNGRHFSLFDSPFDAPLPP